MDTQILAKLFDINKATLDMTTEGFTHEESLISPPGGGQCANWILGHILMARNAILTSLLGQEPLWPEERLAVYERGNSLESADQAQPLAEILEAITAAQKPIVSGIQNLNPEQLAAAAPREFPGGMKTVFEGLSFLHFHETYHIGQIGLLRRIAGKPGAIP